MLTVAAPIDDHSTAVPWSRSHWIAAIVAAASVAAMLLVLPLPPLSTWWWNHKSYLIAPAAAVIAPALWPARRRTLPMVVIGTAALLVFVSLWNICFRRYSGGHRSIQDIFRSTMRNPWAPMYGEYDNALTRRSTLPFVILSTFIAAIWYCWGRRSAARQKWGVGSFAILLALQLAMIVALALCAPWPMRISPTAAGYHEFQVDVPVFVSSSSTTTGEAIAALLRQYVAKMPTLGQYGQHYPPGNLVLLVVEQQAKLPGLTTAIVVLCVILSVIALAMLAREIALEPVATNAALLMYAASAGVLMFCTINTTSLLLLPACLCGWALLRGLKSGSIAAAIVLGLAFAFYLFFSFSASIFGVLLALTTIIGWSNGAFAKEDVFRIAFVALLTLALIVGLLAVTSGFNLFSCFVAAVHNHQTNQSMQGFDNLHRYLIRSSGNIIAYLMSIVPLCILAAAGMGSIWRDSQNSLARALFFALGATLLIAGFSGLFFLETERIWIFLTPFFALAAGDELARRAQREGQGLIAALLLMALVVSCTQEFFFKHYR